MDMIEILLLLKVAKDVLYSFIKNVAMFFILSSVNNISARISSEEFLNLCKIETLYDTHLVLEAELIYLIKRTSFTINNYN